MTTKMYLPDDHALTQLFGKREIVAPNLGAIIPNLGMPVQDTEYDRYPEEIHHRVVYGMGCYCGIGVGWYDIIRDLDEAITKIYPFYVVDQVKEKFGGLRYYIGALPEDFPPAQRTAIYKLIDDAEAKAEETCDVCGAVGQRVIVDKRLVAIRCKKHAEQIDR